ncbi:hypothetical protein CITRIK5_70579 [Citricoccus sp. K5]|nr:hypothetical protein CITRIK5_70579 [Citricoccus sp. K5]
MLTRAQCLTCRGRMRGMTFYRFDADWTMLIHTPFTFCSLSEGDGLANKGWRDHRRRCP